MNDAFMPPPSTMPAILQPSRAGRKRARIMKTLEAELVSKQGTGQGKGMGPRAGPEAHEQRDEISIFISRLGGDSEVPGRWCLLIDSDRQIY